MLILHEPGMTRISQGDLQVVVKVYFFRFRAELWA